MSPRPPVGVFRRHRSVTLLERALRGDRGPRFIPPHPNESLVSSLASPLAGCQSPYQPNGNLLTGKDLDCFGKLSQESTEAGWTNGSNRLTREILMGRDLTSWTLVQSNCARK